MSTTTMDDGAAEAQIADAPVAEPTPTADPDVTTFRGRTLEELLPQIREQLGPDAVVIRQRDGLMGGIGGFFQQRFVEVDARAGHPRVDVYDEQPEPFATLLAAAEAEAEAPGDDGGPRIRPSHRQADSRSSVEPATPAPAPALTQELTRAGMSHAFAVRLVADAEAHELPFAGDLRAAVRRALARRIPTAMPHRAGGLAVAFAGPGSTACASALAAAYKRAGREARAVATLDQARARLERGNPDELVALDLPPIAAERDEVAGLAARVARLALDELLVVLPADLDLPSARALHERLAPLLPTGAALACEPAAAPGAALELVCTTRLPLAYVLDGAALVPADPTTLAERLLP